MGCFLVMLPVALILKISETIGRYPWQSAGIALLSSLIAGYSYRWYQKRQKALSAKKQATVNWKENQYAVEIADTSRWCSEALKGKCTTKSIEEKYFQCLELLLAMYPKIEYQAQLDDRLSDLNCLMKSHRILMAEKGRYEDYLKKESVSGIQAQIAQKDMARKQAKKNSLERETLKSDIANLEVRLEKAQYCTQKCVQADILLGSVNVKFDSLRMALEFSKASARALDINPAREGIEQAHRGIMDINQQTESFLKAVEEVNAMHNPASQYGKYALEESVEAVRKLGHGQ